ncbi:MAG: C40 family peptidase [Bacteroidales bacterium]|nr:C40 family peptidase [Bacteroidales bacterium]
MSRFFCILTALLLLGGAVHPAGAQTDSGDGDPRKTADQIIKEAGRHLGKPYSYGANGPKSFDCSGFTCYVFQKSGYTLPRSSAEQAQAGREVRGGFDKLQKGDLVIFGGRSAKKHPGHVGIFIATDSLARTFTFIHASSSGVTISRSDEPYWDVRYLGARRILPDFPKQEEETVRERFNLSDFFRGRDAAARDSVLNAIQERHIVLFPDGSWAFVNPEGQYTAPPGDRDFILNADATWRTDEASSAEFYTVKSGDSLAKIANQFGTTVESLREMNGMPRRAILKIGQRIRVR